MAQNSRQQSYLGKFVKTPRGIGKVVRFEQQAVVVSLYTSLLAPEEMTFPVRAIGLLRLPKQARCFIPRPEGQGWQFGRIGGFDEVSGKYEVLLPDGLARWLPERDVLVRASSEDTDPTDTLIAMGHETAYFVKHRDQLARELLRQKAATRGYTGLASSRIDLWLHQVEVIRRVLEDPVPRYLLADEVGLGKTIEAGVIIRQCLLDQPNAQVLVLVPGNLVAQWNQELARRCDVFSLPGTVEVRSVEELEEVPLEGPFDMVVVDEVHHVANWAYGSSSERARFLVLAEVAHAARGLLLLSATPAAHREKQFLAVLHLLDPKVYKLDAHQLFQQQMAVRHEVGEILYDLDSTSFDYLLRDKLETLQERFAADAKLGELCSKALVALKEDVQARKKAIADVVAHVSETYRLHRRLLRSRRADAQVYSWRADKACTPVLATSDEGRDAESAFEQWRESIADMVRRAAASETLADLEHDAALLVWYMAELLDRAPVELAECLRYRVGERNAHLTGCCVQDAEIKDLLRRVPLEDTEREAARLLSERVLRLTSSSNRLSTLSEWVRALRDRAGANRPPRCVVFAGCTEVARSVQGLLAQQFGGGRTVAYLRTMTLADRQAAVAAFRQKWDCFVMVCDRSAEEGLNLEFVDHVVHFDLPWDPNQVEQRIGRLDRIGRQKGFTTLIMRQAPDEFSIQAGWMEQLDAGFGVFRRSIASLQYFVEDRMAKIRATALFHGAPGMRHDLPELMQAVADELVRVEQEALVDGYMLDPVEAQRLWNSLDSADAHSQELQQGIEGWLCHALQFEKDTRQPIAGTLRYSAPAQALVPTANVRAAIGTALKNVVTFDRTIAAEANGVALCRLGDPLLDGLVRLVRSDDRGRAFAIWRQLAGRDPTPGTEWVGFRFDILVSADDSPFRTLDGMEGVVVSPHAIGRRLDRFLPTMRYTVFVGTDGEVVEDPALRAELTRPFSKDGAGHYKDVNLTKERLSFIEQVVPGNLWQAVCLEARQKAIDAVRLNSEQEARRQRAQSDAAQKLHRDQAQLSYRANVAVNPDLREAAEHELEFELALGHAVIEGVAKPRMQVDVAGFIVLAGRPPN